MAQPAPGQFCKRPTKTCRTLPKWRTSNSPLLDRGCSRTIPPRLSPMRVTFTRTGQRRYRITVEGKGVISSFMEPAAGYDDRLPHDLAHFVVENYLGLSGGVFGRLAADGHAFQPLDGSHPRGTKGRDTITAEQR